MPPLNVTVWALLKFNNRPDRPGTHSRQTRQHHWPICLLPEAESVYWEATSSPCTGSNKDASHSKPVWAALNFKKKHFLAGCAALQSMWLLDAAFKMSALWRASPCSRGLAGLTPPVMDTVTRLTRSGDGSGDDSLPAPEVSEGLADANARSHKLV